MAPGIGWPKTPLLLVSGNARLLDIVRIMMKRRLNTKKQLETAVRRMASGVLAPDGQ